MIIPSEQLKKIILINGKNNYNNLSDKQIDLYYETNDLFFNGQHGLRDGHSCE